MGAGDTKGDRGQFLVIEHQRSGGPADNGATWVRAARRRVSFRVDAFSVEEIGEDGVGHLVVEAVLGEVFQQRRPVVARYFVGARYELLEFGVLISLMNGQISGPNKKNARKRKRLVEGVHM